MTVCQISTALLPFVLLVSACASSQTPGQKNASELSSKATDLEKSLTDGKAELQSVVTEHAAIVNNTDGDLIGHYKKFNGGIGSLEKRREDIKRRVEAMRLAAESYFSSWSLENEKLTNEDLKERAADRMEKTRQRQKEILDAGTKVRDLYPPLHEKLKDHAIYLGNDLNAESAATLKEDLEDIQEDAKEITDSIDVITKACRDFTAAIAMKTEMPAAETPPEASEEK